MPKPLSAVYPSSSQHDRPSGGEVPHSIGFTGDAAVGRQEYLPHHGGGMQMKHMQGKSKCHALQSLIFYVAYKFNLLVCFVVFCTTSNLAPGVRTE
jgi:hypothetical protein